MSNFHSSRNDLIDVNQNDGLLSSSYRSSKDKQVMEVNVDFFVIVYFLLTSAVNIFVVL